MKRINPDTGKTFKRRDKRPSCDIQDDKLFASNKKRFNLIFKASY